MDCSGEAEIARMRVEDAEPETVYRHRRVQGRALISDARCTRGVKGRGKQWGNTPSPMTRNSTTSARNRMRTTTTSGDARKTGSEKSTFNSAFLKCGFALRKNAVRDPYKNRDFRF